MGSETQPSEGWMPGLVVRLVAAAAGGAGVFTLFTAAQGPDPDARALLDLTQYTLWRLLIAGLTAVGVAIAPNLWRMYREVFDLHRLVAAASPQPGRTRTAGPACLWVWYAVLVVAIVLGQFLSTSLQPMAGWQWRTATLFLVGLLVLSPAVTGMWLVTATLLRLHRVIEATPVSPDGQLQWDEQRAETVRQLIRLRTLSQRLLAAMSAAVSAVTVSTGTLRAALLAEPHPPAYPVAAPLLLGLFFSIIVAASYLPAATTLQDLCGDFADKVSPIPAGELSKDWSEQRQRVEKLLPTSDGVKDATQTSVAIIAPLVASLSSVLFK
jgi:hypothetical protein